MMKAEKEKKSNKQLLGKDEQKSWFIRGEEISYLPILKAEVNNWGCETMTNHHILQTEFMINNCFIIPLVCLFHFVIYWGNAAALMSPQSRDQTVHEQSIDCSQEEKNNSPLLQQNNFFSLLRMTNHYP